MNSDAGPRKLPGVSPVPFALVTVWLPAALGTQLSRDDAQRAPFYELLAARGTTLGSATQTIGAAISAAGPWPMTIRRTTSAKIAG